MTERLSMHAGMPFAKSYSKENYVVSSSQWEFPNILDTLLK